MIRLKIISIITCFEEFAGFDQLIARTLKSLELLTLKEAIELQIPIFTIKRELLVVQHAVIPKFRQFFKKLAHGSMDYESGPSLDRLQSYVTLFSFKHRQVESDDARRQKTMKLLSVNVSLPRDISHGGKTVRTGIFKQPIKDRVMLRGLNIEGDGQADLVGHVGTYKAAYVYSVENYRYWETELGRSDFEFEQFGENFTVEGMLNDIIRVGDIFCIGGALIEVSQPRVSCFKLGIRMGIQGFEHILLSSNRIGFYLRVLKEGEVSADDTFETVDTDPERMSVADVNNLLYFDLGNLEGARKALRIKALSPGRYCGGISRQAGKIIMQSGVYLIADGDLEIRAQAEVLGNGVTIVLLNSSGNSDPAFTINGGAEINLTAPTSGEFSGIVFFQDSNISEGTNTFNGNSSTNFTGALYFPTQTVKLLGNNESLTGCTQIVALIIEFRGNAGLSNQCDYAGTTPVSIPGNVQLVELEQQ